LLGEIKMADSPGLMAKKLRELLGVGNEARV
jgi:hypothetical protein